MIKKTFLISGLLIIALSVFAYEKGLYRFVAPVIDQLTAVEDLSDIGTIVYDITDDTFYGKTRDGFEAISREASITPQTCYLKDVRTATTNGGSATTSYTDRVLNTVTGDCGFVTLSNGSSGTGGTNTQFQIPAGKYEVVASAPCYQCEAFQTKLQNITDTATIELGSSEYSENGAGLNYQTNSRLETSFTLTSSKTLSLQQIAFYAKVTDGWGSAANLGGNSVYAQLRITKIE
ncbi:MAG: hypothetical protein A2381_01090 [Bdellovibrionales bacterium RIFOXYB1_FULL_37_110]|nr:MAG: hypothetical protein A2417_01945 [Bdellovibrionales bacterium RIFOXYC1_FULL_37_79]OFZ58813.1 MAG: hypothetical protein A2381_01090 [Bdellovibrionales bacterium RIFOXYB1_FULL_37_110]OFZ64812.1 MAG: hypothetical protein A2577_07090 [Bdellovibrionales bacterium RIFOXYD1_FULL_36_51]